MIGNADHIDKLSDPSISVWHVFGTNVYKSINKSQSSTTLDHNRSKLKDRHIQRPLNWYAIGPSEWRESMQILVRQLDTPYRWRRFRQFPHGQTAHGHRFNIESISLSPILNDQDGDWHHTLTQTLTTVVGSSFIISLLSHSLVYFFPSWQWLDRSMHHQLDLQTNRYILFSLVPIAGARVLEEFELNHHRISFLFSPLLSTFLLPLANKAQYESKAWESPTGSILTWSRPPTIQRSMIETNWFQLLTTNANQNKKYFVKKRFIDLLNSQVVKKANRVTWRRQSAYSIILEPFVRLI